MAPKVSIELFETELLLVTAPLPLIVPAMFMWAFALTVSSERTQARISGRGTWISGVFVCCMAWEVSCVKRVPDTQWKEQREKPDFAAWVSS